MVECVWLPVARNCNETWGGSDEIKWDDDKIMWEMSDKMKDDSNETKDNSNKMRETHNSKEREVIVKQNLLATTPNSSWDSDLG